MEYQEEPLVLEDEESDEEDKDEGYIDTGDVIDVLTVKELKELCKEKKLFVSGAKAVLQQRLKEYYNSHPDDARPAGKKKQKKQDITKWVNSTEKQTLREDIIMNLVTTEMSAQEVYEMRGGIYKKFKFENFQTNLTNLRAVIHVQFKYMQKDCEAMGFDQGLLETLQPTRYDATKPIDWHRSPAKKLLKKDVDDGLHLQKKPKDLHASRPEYMAFDLKVFRKHIYQEVESRDKIKSRIERKKLRPTKAQRPPDHCGAYEL